MNDIMVLLMHQYGSNTLSVKLVDADFAALLLIVFVNSLAVTHNCTLSQW